jgi:hypothetical protein
MSTSFFEYSNTSDRKRKKKTLLIHLLYSQQENHMISKKVAKFIKLIKRFRILQVWLKSSDIWRWLSGLKSELFEAFSKVEVLMFFDKRALSISFLMFFAAYLTSLFIFLMLACRRTSKSQLLKKLQKALISDLIINVKYRSIWVILAGFESVWSA